MQANKEIGKIQSNTPFVIAQALELFIEDITRLSANLALRNHDTKVNPSHIKTVIMDHSGDPFALHITHPYIKGAPAQQPQSTKFGFLKEAVIKLPDLKLGEEILAERDARQKKLEQEAAGARRKTKAKGSDVGSVRRSTRKSLLSHDHEERKSDNSEDEEMNSSSQKPGSAKRLRKWHLIY